MHFCNIIISPVKGPCPSFEQNWIPLTLGCFVSSLGEIWLTTTMGKFWSEKLMLALCSGELKILKLILRLQMLNTKKWSRVTKSLAQKTKNPSKYIFYSMWTNYYCFKLSVNQIMKNKWKTRAAKSEILLP